MVLNMAQYTYTNITVIVTDVIILGFLSAQFVNQGALLPVYLF